MMRNSQGGMRPLVWLSILIMMLAAIPGAAEADLSGWRIGVDPGHGGTDPGAVGSTGLQEKEVNLDASLSLRAHLIRANAEVYITRTTDVTLSLASRANFMNASDVDRSICVHHNASSNPDPNWHLSYVAVGYGWATSGDLAADVASRVTDFNGLGFGWSNIGRPGVSEENFYMLVYTTMPSILPEISFISNPQEEQRLYRDRYCYGNGQGMAYGVMDHFGGWGGKVLSSGELESDETDAVARISSVSVSPNPFNAEAVLSFTLPAASDVTVALFNLKGELVGTLLTETLPSGSQQITLPAHSWPSGVYFLRIASGAYGITRKVLLLR